MFIAKQNIYQCNKTKKNEYRSKRKCNNKILTIRLKEKYEKSEK